MGYFSSSSYTGSWSPSKSVSNFFGIASTVNTTTSNNGRFAQVLAELKRTANMIQNGQSDVESEFRVKFSDNASVLFEQDSMTISPDILLTPAGELKSGGSYFNALDALNGRVLLGTHIRKNMGAMEFDVFAKHDDVCAKSFFQTAVTNQAAESIRSEWAGFTPYLDCHKEETSKKKHEVEIPTSLVDKELEKFAQVINWNLGSDDKIETGNEEIDAVIREVEGMITNDFADCISASKHLSSKLKKTGGEKPKSDGKDGSGGAGASKSSGGAEKAEAKPSMKSMSPWDSEILSNEKIESEKPELASMKGDNGEDDVLDIKGLKVVVDDNVAAQSRHTTDAKADYTKFCLTHRSSIKQVEKCFLFQENQSALYSRGLSVGDIDEGNLHKVRFDPEFIYERKDVPKQMEHQIGILLDQSGSMGNGRMKAAREVLITIHEGLKQYKSIRQVIYGHSGQEYNQTDCIMIPYLDGSIDNTHHLIHAPARLQNLDGFAIKYVTDRMLSHPIDGKRMLLVISDGSPSGYGYGGASAYAHTLRSCQSARRRGVQVFGIGVCNAFCDRQGNQIYGAGNFAILDDVESSMKVMVNKLKKFCSSL